MLLYEVDPRLQTGFPDIVDEFDSNNGVSMSMTRLILNMGQIVKTYYNRSVEYKLPRMLWVGKNTTCKQLHVEIFEFVRPILAEWIDAVDPNSKKPSSNVNFPYSSQRLTKKSFLEMPL